MVCNQAATPEADGKSYIRDLLCEELKGLGLQAEETNAQKWRKRYVVLKLQNDECKRRLGACEQTILRLQAQLRRTAADGTPPSGAPPEMLDLLFELRRRGDEGVGAKTKTGRRKTADLWEPDAPPEMTELLLLLKKVGEEPARKTRPRRRGEQAVENGAPCRPEEGVTPVTSRGEDHACQSPSDAAVETLVGAVIGCLLQKAPRKTRKSLRSEDVAAIARRVTERGLEELGASVAAAATQPPRGKKVEKTVTKSLMKDFGSAEKAWRSALVTHDTTFEDAVVSHLRLQLDSPRGPPRRKSKIGRFFSTLWPV